MEDSDAEVEHMWEGEEEDMDDEEKTWLIQRLREKVSDLKEQLRLVSTFGCEGSVSGDSGPVAHVVFFNNIESMSGRQRVDDMMQNLANSVRNSQLQVEAVTHYHQPSAVLINSSEGDGECEEEEGEEEEVCVVGSVEYYSDFCLDWRGVPVKEIGGGEGGRAVEWKPNEDSSVLYGQVYMEPFWVDTVRRNEERRLRRMAIECFNCGDDHHIKDCPEPKDFARINAKKQEYLASLGTQGADRRYHMTSSDDRFKKFVPGKISDKLRKALGLMNETDHPPYIYRMRELDYPPGYRLLAMESTLRLYDNGDDVTEKENQDVIKKEDLIIFPGFNSPDVVLPPSNYQLGCGVPPSSKGQSETGKTDENTEKLKEWLDFKPAKETTQVEDMDDLGSLSDYEFEEAELTEDGKEVVGFGLRKLLKTSTDGDKRTTFQPPPGPKKVFSLDFPPGWVHDESECVKSPQRWKEIKKILEEKKPKKKKSAKERPKRD